MEKVLVPLCTKKILNLLLKLSLVVGSSGVVAEVAVFVKVDMRCTLRSV